MKDEVVVSVFVERGDQLDEPALPIYAYADVGVGRIQPQTVGRNRPDQNQEKQPPYPPQASYSATFDTPRSFITQQLFDQPFVARNGYTLGM